MHGTLVDVKVIKDAVRLACRAPSLHNSQPWRLDRDGKGVHLFLDTSRIMPSTDRSAREAIISCGALLDHLRVAWRQPAGRRMSTDSLIQTISTISHLSISRQ